jgi:hypothetical protein
MNRIDDAAARDPFRPRAASSSPFPSLAFERARADATASLARGVPRIAIVGPAGVGKSALLAQLARDVAPAGDVAWLHPPATSVPEAATLLVDEIDRLDPITRAALLARPKTTRMIVAGIDDPDPSDDTVWVVLTPLEPHEVGPYVQHRLRNAGLPADLFDDEAIARLGHASARVPRVLDALAGRALFAAKLDEADTVRAVHARQAIEEHAALLAAAAAPVEIAPELVDTALAFAASDDEEEAPPVLRATETDRALAAAAPKRRRRSAVPLFGAVAVGCFVLGAVLVLSARASDAPTQTLATTPELTEADAYRTANLAPPPVQQTDAGQRIVVQYGRADADGAQRAQAIADRLRQRGFQVAEVRPVDLRINQASVRYYFDGDRARSVALEREVDALVRETGVAPKSELLPMRYVEPKPRPGTLEIWLPSASAR